MAKLTESQIENMTTPGRLPDDQSLSFEITKTGLKRWVYRYRLEGRGGTYIIGRYPELTLKQARKALKEARELVKKGLNPAKTRRIKKRESMAEISGMNPVFVDPSVYSYLKWICGREKIEKREALEKAIVNLAKSLGCKF